MILSTTQFHSHLVNNMQKFVQDSFQIHASYEPFVPLVYQLLQISYLLLPTSFQLLPTSFQLLLLSCQLLGLIYSLLVMPFLLLLVLYEPVVRQL